MIVSVHGDGTIYIWNALTGEIIKILTINEHYWMSMGNKYGVRLQNLHGAAFSPGGKILAIGGTGFPVYLWDIQTGRCCGKLPVNSYTIFIESIVFSPIGDILAVIGSKGDVSPILTSFWDINSYNRITVPTEIENTELKNLSFSKSSRYIVYNTGYYKTVLRKFPSFELVNEIETEEHILSVEFSSDEKVLFASSSTGKTHYWSVETGEELATMHLSYSGILITSPADKFYPNGLFYTKNLELITVFKENPDGAKEIVLGSERDAYISTHNRKLLVQARLRGDLAEYERLAKMDKGMVENGNKLNAAKYSHQMALGMGNV
jgi:WD40 repeat protein